jgi:hypothetical protein
LVDTIDFNEISRRNAKSRKKLAIIIFLFWKYDEKKSKKTKYNNKA